MNKEIKKKLVESLGLGPTQFKLYNPGTKKYDLAQISSTTGKCKIVARGVDKP